MDKPRSTGKRDLYGREILEDDLLQNAEGGVGVVGYINDHFVAYDHLENDNFKQPEECKVVRNMIGTYSRSNINRRIRRAVYMRPVLMDALSDGSSKEILREVHGDIHGPLMEAVDFHQEINEQMDDRPLTDRLLRGILQGSTRTRIPWKQWNAKTSVAR